MATLPQAPASPAKVDLSRDWLAAHFNRHPRTSVLTLNVVRVAQAITEDWSDHGCSSALDDLMWNNTGWQAELFPLMGWGETLMRRLVQAEAAMKGSEGSEEPRVINTFREMMSASADGMTAFLG